MTVAFLNVFALVSLIRFGSRVDDTFVSSQTHGTSHVGDGFLFLHDVDDIVRSLFVHLAAVGIGITQYIAGKFDGHALHTQTDTEGRHVVCTAIFDGDELTFDTALAESRTDDNSVHVFQLFFNVFFCQVLTVDEVDVCLAVVVGSRL